MSKYPEKIWAYAGSFKMWREKYPEHATSTNPTEYIRADVAQAMVAAAYEVAAISARCDGNDFAANEIEGKTPADARAALDAMVAKARNDALREAAERLLGTVKREYGDHRDYRVAILALINRTAEDTSHD